MSRNSLKQVLSGWDVFFIAVGQIIGAGVIALTGIAIGMTGPSVILAYLLSAVLVLIVTILIMMAGSVLPAVGCLLFVVLETQRWLDWLYRSVSDPSGECVA